MAAVDFHPTVPADPQTNKHDLLTLQECKLLLGLDPALTTYDQTLALQISIYSQAIEREIPRVLAKETGVECWREDGGSGRIFLTHFPVKAGDITNVTAGGSVIAPSAYELEERSGKLSNRTSADAQAAPWPLP